MVRHPFTYPKRHLVLFLGNGKIHQSEVTSLCTTPEMVKCDRYVAFKSSGGGWEWRFVKKNTWGMGCVVFFFFLMEGSLDTKFGSINEV